MTIAILKKSGEFFPPAVLRDFPPIAVDKPREGHALSPLTGATPLGDGGFRQPAVFRLDPKVRKDSGPGISLGSAAILAGGAVAMAIRWEDIDKLLDTLCSSISRAEKRSIIDRLIEEARQNPLVVPAMLQRIADPKMPSEEILQGLARLDLGAWEDLAKQNHLVLTILFAMHEVVQHEGARAMLQRLDLQEIRNDVLEHEFGLFLHADDLMVLAELGNSQAWSILGEVDIRVLQSAIRHYRQGEADFEDNARLAILTMTYVARSGGKNGYAAIEALRNETIGADLIWDREAVLEVLGPLLALENPSAQELARSLDLEALQKLPSRNKPSNIRRVALYDAIGAVLEHSQCKRSLGQLVQAVEAGDPEAFRVLDMLARKGYKPAQDYLNTSVSLAIDNRKMGRKPNEALINLTLAILGQGSRSLNASFRALRTQVLEHPGIKAIGSITVAHEVSIGIWKAWRDEPLRDIYLRLETKPMSSELIPSSYIEAYVEHSLERNAKGLDLVHEGILPPEDWKGWELTEDLAPKPSPEELESFDLRNRISLGMAMNWGTAFTELPPDQKRVLASEIAASWLELSPSDRQAFAEQSPGELFPSAFLRSFEASNSALFRPWSDAELGNDLGKDPKRGGGPKGIH
ncbi:hypothetical protein FBR05_03580 [Deltaproteobacteria bacterium PRO3]|nr:hypothetical protein [Deltaproteobacteria bacterium PRO3]